MIGKMTRVATAVGAALMAMTPACECPCRDAEYEFCEQCFAQGKTPFKCEYDYEITRYNPDGSPYQVKGSRQRTGCYDSIDDMAAVCQEACDGYGDCLGIDVDAYPCDGEDACAAGDATAGGGDATAGAAPIDCSGWAPASAVQLDPASGGRTITWDFWFGLISQPELATCDGTVLDFDPTGAGIIVSNVGPGSLAEALGLGNGDLVLELDGHPLGSVDDVYSAAFDVVDELSFEIVVQHGATTEILQYEVQ